MEDVKGQVAEALRRAREEAGLTQSEVAGTLGMSPQSISAYESGNREAGYVALSALADTYGTTVGAFFTSSATANAKPARRASTPVERRLERRVQEVKSEFDQRLAELEARISGTITGQRRPPE